MSYLNDFLKREDCIGISAEEKVYIIFIEMFPEFLEHFVTPADAGNILRPSVHVDDKSCARLKGLIAKISSRFVTCKVKTSILLKMPQNPDKPVKFGRLLRNKNCSL